MYDGKRDQRPWNKRTAAARKVPIERSLPLMIRMSSQLFRSCIAERDRKSSVSRVAIVMSQKIPLKRHPRGGASGEEGGVAGSIFVFRRI